MSNVTALRPVTLGGSDAAAAAGVDPYRSPVMLWCEKTGRVEREATEAMRWGTALEQVIVSELEVEGYEVDRPKYTGTYHAERPWLIGHPDGFVTLEGAPAVLEIKTASPFAARWDERPPIHYEAQCQVYMHLTGLDRALLACLVGGQRLVLRDVDRDDKAIGLLLAALEQMHDQIVMDTPPAPDGSDSTRDALAALYPHAGADKVYRLTRPEFEAYTALRALREQRDVVDGQIREHENLLKAAMGDAQVAVSPHDAECVRWSNVTRTAVDVTLLKAQRPELASLFTTTTETRRFTVT